jgi:hypothetical protein
MTAFNISEMRNSSVWTLYRQREEVDLEPAYQREGDIWPLDKRQLLVDTILNGFDVPKLYVHKLSEPTDVGGRQVTMAVVDGKQRLSAMWDFIQGRFPLSRDFVYLRDEGINLSNFKYADIAREHPDIKADFDAYNLDVVAIETDDLEIIEDLFYRLNEAMPLNAAEKRNARPGPLPRLVRQLALHAFFVNKVPFSNRRYRHLDLSAKMLLQSSRQDVGDTKKAYVDSFFNNHARDGENDLQPIFETASGILTLLDNVFADRDPLLRSIGMLLLYFMAMRRAVEVGQTAVITRPALAAFEERRVLNRVTAENDIGEADYDLLEFDRYTQSPNDAIALRFRLRVLDEKCFHGRLRLSAPETGEGADPEAT